MRAPEPRSKSTGTQRLRRRSADPPHASSLISTPANLDPEPSSSGIDRREFLKAAAFGAAASLGSSFALSDLARAATAPTCLFGAHAEPRGSETSISAITSLESKIGRKLGIARHYVDWDASIPDPFQVWSAENGRIPYVSWQSWTKAGTIVPWKSIASGKWDSWIRKQATSIKLSGYKMFFCFHHEPEDDPACGTASDFRAAWSRINSIFNNVGTPNLTWVCSLMRSTYTGAHGGPQNWLPATYNLVGSDGYNRWPCSATTDHWRSFEEIFAPGRNAARSRGKGFFVGECGTIEQTDCGHTGLSKTAKAKWFSDAVTTIKGWPEVKAVVYSHTMSKLNGVTLKYWADTSTSSMAAFKAFAQDPYFN